MYPVSRLAVLPVWVVLAANLLGRGTLGRQTHMAANPLGRMVRMAVNPCGTFIRHGRVYFYEICKILAKKTIKYLQT